MSLTPEALYFQLGRLVAEMPDLASDPITPATVEWMGRAATLVELAGGGLAESIRLKVAFENLVGGLRERNAQTIATIVHGALAKAELDAPPEARGTFMVADNDRDAFTAVRKLLETARDDLLLVDPNADAKVLTNYAILARDNVVVRLLADQAGHKRSLETAAQRWPQKFGRARPLIVRVAAVGALHDTLVVVDGVSVWALGQSFDELAKRAYTSLVRMPPHTAKRMISAYAAIWQAARPLAQPQ